MSVTARVANKRHLGAGFENRNGSAVGVCQFLRYDNRDLSRRREWLAIITVIGETVKRSLVVRRVFPRVPRSGKARIRDERFSLSRKHGSERGRLLEKDGLPGRSDSTKATRS